MTKFFRAQIQRNKLILGNVARSRTYDVAANRYIDSSAREGFLATIFSTAIELVVFQATN